MKAIDFNFEIHQPFRLKRYRFFDIGNDHYYYDDFLNDDIITRLAQQSYIPAAESLLRMIEETKGAFRCSISVSGVALEQFEVYVPEFIDLLKKLAKTGSVEFTATTYAHSLASLFDPEEFEQQVKAQCEKIETLLGVKPKVLRNTELIYCDEFAPQILAMGFKGCITEGAKHILGWKSPNYVYSAASAPKLKLLLNNSKLVEDIAQRFGDTTWEAYPLTADKYIDWIASTPQEEQIITLCLNLETFGAMQPAQTGIFQFLEALPRFAAERGVEFWTPSMAISKLKAVGESCEKPLEYYDNNLYGTLVLLETMRAHGCKKMVFSSSATVYGDPERLPITETCKTGGTTNPYGTSKYFQEIMLQDLFKADNEWTIVLLRYFNPVGAHPSGLIGEDPQGIPNNLTPYIANVAIGQLKKIGVFGNDYDTPDGTGVRDYIHVVDLALGHVAAIEGVKHSGVFVYNLGTGNGYSVLQVIKAFDKACGRDLPYVIKGRRAGDIATCYADATKAEKELGWKATRNIDDMCASLWNWQTKNPNGYKS